MNSYLKRKNNQTRRKKGGTHKLGFLTKLRYPLVIPLEKMSIL